MSNLKTTGLAAAGLLVGMLAAVAAGAQDTTQPQSDAPKLVVRFNAAQLQSEQGVHRLYANLQQAAKQVCPQPVGVLVSGSVRECRRQAVADAVAQIHSSRLAAVSNQSLKSG